MSILISIYLSILATLGVHGSSASTAVRPDIGGGPVGHSYHARKIGGGPVG